MKWTGFIGLAVLLTNASLADTPDQWIDRQPVEFHDMLAASQDGASLGEYRDQCPADVFPRFVRWGKGSQDCTSAPGLCQVQCRAGISDACFGLARVIETRMERAGRSNFSFPYYMAACDAGHPNGCTNAAATAKNGTWLPGTRPKVAISPDCQFRTYDASCEAGATWGCYMLGIEFGYSGVDGKTDTLKAKEAFAKSCALQPDGSACKAARNQMKLLSGQD